MMVDYFSQSSFNGAKQGIQFFKITKHGNIILIEKPHYYNYGYPHNPGYNTSEFFCLIKKYCKAVSVEIESQGSQNLSWVRACFLTFCSTHSKYVMRAHVRMRCSIQFDIIFLRFIWCRFRLVTEHQPFQRVLCLRQRRMKLLLRTSEEQPGWAERRRRLQIGSQHTLMLV